MWYEWLLPLFDLLQQSPRMVLRTTTNLLDQKTVTVFRCRKKIVREIFAVTDNRENFPIYGMRMLFKCCSSSSSRSCSQWTCTEMTVDISNLCQYSKSHKGPGVNSSQDDSVVRSCEYKFTHNVIDIKIRLTDYYKGIWRHGWPESAQLVTISLTRCMSTYYHVIHSW